MAKPIRLETDSSGYVIAGIILQQAKEVQEAQEGLSDRAECAAKNHWHPVVFWSRSMSSAKCNYTVGDKIMLTIVLSCIYWRHYLEGARHLVEVMMDHNNLQRFKTTKPLTE